MNSGRTKSRRPRRTARDCVRSSLLAREAGVSEWDVRRVRVVSAMSGVALLPRIFALADAIDRR
eukprot:6515105-Prymnesium_polylepis.1